MTMRVHVKYYLKATLKWKQQILKNRSKIEIEVVRCLKSHKGDRGLDKESIMPDCPTKISKHIRIKEPPR